MAQARQLLDQGHSRDGLLLALDALVVALIHLQNSLLALQRTLSRFQGLASPAPSLKEEPPQPGVYPVPGRRPLLH